MDKQDKLQLMYIFPNLFTAASAFLGVIGILASARGDFEKAAIYIVLSLIFDGLDGRVARITKTTSRFGAEFDSLADVIAFGVAPAMLFYFSVAHMYGKVGSLFCAMYVVFGAIRLARFNVMTASVEPSVFIGIPIPGAALAVSMWVLVYLQYPIFQGFEVAMLIGVGVVSFLMVSNIRYPSFKKIDMKKANMLKVFIGLSVVLSLLYIFPVESTTIIINVYILYGLARTIYNIIAKRKKNEYNS
ncbi:MAG: CDP-diacylglycerol--serine O-phosphatidyltransferase [Sulfurospirillum sp.]|nr:CDP-diacylglycerol--serine O-phosphatidyltransferase [Sulfurospirillum sp.]